MSPARARTSLSGIVAAGRELLEAGGLDALTMVAVAESVGVQAPSLYKHVPNRAALIAAIGTDTLSEIATLMAPLADDPSPTSGMRSIAGTFRAYAHAHPRSYELLFRDLPADSRPPAEHNAKASAPLVEATARLVGPDHALEAARLLTAFVHGFVSMELSGAFRLGGDTDSAFRYGVDVLVDALARRPRANGAALDRSP